LWLVAIALFVVLYIFVPATKSRTSHAQLLEVLE